jgi:hypothetical protein
VSDSPLTSATHTLRPAAVTANGPEASNRAGVATIRVLLGSTSQSAPVPLIG